MNIIIDFGISYVEFLARLKQVGLENNFQGLLITHTHSDHIRGIAKYMREHKTPIYMHQKMQSEFCEKVGSEDMEIHVFDSVFSVGNIDVLPFATPHDTACSFGYTFACEGKRVSIVTDLGHVSDKVFAAIKDSDMVLLEANYDVEMLQNGSYPVFLKHRIASNRGHLSNGDCAMLCCDLVRNRTRKIILAHISENNNLPATALREVKEYLQKENLLKNVQLYLAEQNYPSDIIEI